MMGLLFAEAVTLVIGLIWPPIQWMAMLGLAIGWTTAMIAIPWIRGRRQ